MYYLAVAIGGAAGAAARYACYRLADRLSLVYFPYATLFVNSVGSFLMAFLLGLMMGNAGVAASVRLFLFTGFFGAFTTFATFAVENAQLMQQGQYFICIINILLNNVFSIGLALTGYCLARLLVS